MPFRLPALLAAPPEATGRRWLTNARLFDATSDSVVPGAAVLLDGARIERIGRASEPAPGGAEVVDLEGRTLLPGLIDAHAHVVGRAPIPAPGAEPLLAGTSAHLLAADLREALRRGFTTMRDVGSYGDQVFEARQAMRYGAFAGPRLLTCGRIVAATSPGGRFFDGMYAEADGPDAMRAATRAQLRRGADYVKVMATGARSVELEDPDPAQTTPEELAAIVEEAHRLGYRVAAHAEGLAGTELAIRSGVDTIEHGMYLHRRPDLLDEMAAAGQTLVPTLSCYYGVAGLGEAIGTQLGGRAVERSVGAPGGAPGDGHGHAPWTPPLVSLAEHNLAEAATTLVAARDAGVPIALGHDWNPIYGAALELARLVHHGLSPAQALRAATACAAEALGLGDRIGTVEAGKLADLVVTDGDPLEDPGLLRDRERIWLVVQLGTPVAGRALEQAMTA